MTVGERLKLILDIHKKNATTLAKELNVSRTAIIRAVKDETLPSSILLIPLANMGIDVHWLLTGEGEMFTKKTLSKEEQKIINQGTISSIGDHNSIENKSINETLYLKEIEHLNTTITQLNEIVTQLKAQLKDKEAIIELLSRK